MKKWNVRVLCVAPDKQTAIENVKARVMPDMMCWNFSASATEDVGNSE